MKKTSDASKKAVYVVDGNRTPFLKAKGVGPFGAGDLALAASRPLLLRQPILASDLDEVILGCAMPSPDEANVARVVALRLGCGFGVTGFTVMRNCASGMQALDTAAARIASGQSQLILAGGMDAMSHAPILFNPHMADWLSRWSMAKSALARVRLLAQLRPSFLAPVIALLRGLTDPIVGLNMGQTAENLAYQFQITRNKMDEYACNSHLRLARAYAEGRMDEVTPIIDAKGRVYATDDGLRPDSSVEKLAGLKPFFDKKYGLVTAGNSSQITDGGVVLLLASSDAVKKHKLPVIGRIVDSRWAGLDPAQMGLGPVHAATPLMQKHNLTPRDFAYWEINEAFAAQVLGCVAAWNDADYCKTHFGLNAAMGAPDASILNADGGAIAAGHPIGASGARIVLHCLQQLKSQPEGARAMASICIGGGMGGAMIVERISEVA
ncbi:MAG: acetyl-CoA acetyltransferase [Legionella sp. 21-45-4]|nr:MAG: acetyl-CoA acetyltransferase [Legionella sp. 21-45-4]